MDLEFHYWITGLIALRAGFESEEAKIIAYASQYVDDDDVSIIVKNHNGSDEYVNYISQTMDILKPKDSLMRIYPVFHFVPGDPLAEGARRRDGKMHVLNTTPNSENANALLEAAFHSPQERRLYRIGIATHAYVDTWAHQNFVGWHDAFNGIGVNIKPNIGHADALHHPDWVCHNWEDTRLVETSVNNRSRYMAASKALFEKYCDYLSVRGRVDHSGEWGALQDELLLISGRSYSGDRLRYEDDRLKSYKNRLADWPDFDDMLWLEEAVETKVRGVPDVKTGVLSRLVLFKDEHYWREGVTKEDTHWFKFQQAVKAHEKFAIELLTPTFRNMGYDLANV